MALNLEPCEAVNTETFTVVLGEKGFSVSSGTRDILRWSGSRVTGVWLLKRRVIYRLVQNVGVWCLIAAVLLAAGSVVDNFRACTFLRRSSSPRSVQFSPTANNDQLTQTERLACQWQVVPGAIREIRPLDIKLQPQSTLPRGPENPPPIHTHTPRQDRAPPFLFSSSRAV